MMHRRPGGARHIGEVKITSGRTRTCCVIIDVTPNRKMRQLEALKAKELEEQATLSPAEAVP
jgi:hypothetical protein